MGWAKPPVVLLTKPCAWNDRITWVVAHMNVTRIVKVTQMAIPCKKGHTALFVEYREKTLLTVLGEVTVKRAYYHDKKCHSGFCPKDISLDIVGTSYSPGVRRLMGKVGAMHPFGLGHQDLHELADIRVNAKEVERVSQMVGGQIEAFTSCAD